MKKRALVIGFGVSGKAAAKLLLSKGYDISIFDEKKEIDLSLFNEFNVPIETFSDCEKITIKHDILILSPGISKEHPVCSLAKKWNVPLIGEAEFALSFCEQRAIAITGTNGKTTMTLFLTHLFQTAGLKAKALGNVGNALSEYFLKPDLQEILVVELSSYQIETLSQPCFHYAALLNITPDHLDRYSSFEEYAFAKCQIQKCLKNGKKLFLPQPLFTKWSSFLDKEKVVLVDCEENGLEIAGALSLETVFLSSQISSCMGINKNTFEKAVKSFTPLSHRLEFVKERGGVCYYNDSKATNVEAVIYAVKRLKQPVYLIVGGEDKNFSFQPWRKAFLGRVEKIIAIGKAKEKIYRELSDLYTVIREGSLEEAMQRAKKEAKDGEAVLLSPGCASFDMFKNYEERGELFKKLVEED